MIADDRLILDTVAVDYIVTFDNLAIGAAQAQYLIEKAGATKGNNLYLYAGNGADDNSFPFLEGAWEKLQPRIADGTFVIRNSSLAVALQGNPHPDPRTARQARRPDRHQLGRHHRPVPGAVQPDRRCARRQGHGLHPGPEQHHGSRHRRRVLG